MRRTIVVPALITLAACAAQRQSSMQPAGLRQLAVTSSRNSYVIATAELPRDRLLIDVVAERWPRMVRGELPRGEIDRFATLDRFGVYDARGSFLGGPSYLESLRAADVVEIRRLTMVEEATRFGKGHPAGAVLITWRTATR